MLTGIFDRMARLRRRLICGLWLLMLLFRWSSVGEGDEWRGLVEGDSVAEREANVGFRGLSSIGA